MLGRAGQAGNTPQLAVRGGILQGRGVLEILRRKRRAETLRPTGRVKEGNMGQEGKQP